MKLLELEKRFKYLDLKKFNSTQLNSCVIVQDASLFVSSHLSYLKANPSNETFLPYYDRLLEFYNKIKAYT